MAPESPLACNRHAFSAEERARHFDVLVPEMRSRIRSVDEIEDGYQFEFPGDDAVISLVSEWAEGERRCCPFFEIQLNRKAEAFGFV